MSVPRTLVIVLNYHGATVLLPCLHSLYQSLSDEDAILVVDNGQEQQLMEQVQKMWPQTTILSTDKNLGFARGMNIGLRQALSKGFEAAWVVNNDAVVSPQTLSFLKQAAVQKPGVHLFSPLIFTPDKKIWFAGGTIDYWRMRATHIQESPNTEELLPTGFLTGCALFIPRKTLEEVGFFDERYFLYYEDVDYSTRVLAQGGGLWVVPQAHLTHEETSRYNPEKLYWLVRSGVEFFLTKAPLWARLWARVFVSLRRLKNALILAVHPNPIAEKLKRAYTDALTHIA